MKYEIPKIGSKFKTSTEGVLIVIAVCICKGGKILLHLIDRRDNIIHRSLRHELNNNGEILEKETIEFPLEFGDVFINSKFKKRKLTKLKINKKGIRVKVGYYRYERLSEIYYKKDQLETLETRFEEVVESKLNKLRKILN